MSVLDDLQKFLTTYDRVLTVTLGILGTLSGWLFSWWKSYRDAIPVLSVAMKGQDIVLSNHGTKPIELLSARLSLRDVSSRPDLAKMHHFVISTSCVIASTAEAKIGEASAPIVAAMSEIWAPYAAHMAALGWSSTNPGWAHFQLELSCGILGKRHRHTVTLTRLLSGSPSVGWYLQRPHYDSGYPESWYERARRACITMVTALKSPRAAYQEWKQFGWLREHLRVMGILQAVKEHAITVDQCERELTKLASKSKLSAVELLQRHVDVPPSVLTGCDISSDDEPEKSAE